MKEWKKHIFFSHRVLDFKVTTNEKRAIATKVSGNLLLNELIGWGGVPGQRSNTNDSVFLMLYFSKQHGLSKTTERRSSNQSQWWCQSSTKWGTWSTARSTRPFSGKGPARPRWEYSIWKCWMKDRSGSVRLSRTPWRNINSAPSRSWRWRRRLDFRASGNDETLKLPKLELLKISAR